MEYHMHYSPSAPDAATQETSSSTEPVRVEKKERFIHKNKVLIGFYLFLALILGLTLFYFFSRGETDEELYRWKWIADHDSENMNEDFIINSLLNSKRGKKFILSKLEELIVSYEKEFNVTDKKTKKEDYESLVIREKYNTNRNQKDELNKRVVETVKQNMKHSDNSNNNNKDVILPIYENGKIWNASFLLDNLDGVVAFDNFIKTFQKEYETLDEKHKRFTNFMYNYLKVKEHNSRGDVYYQINVNRFSDMSYEELRAKYLTLKSFQSTDMGSVNRLFTEESTDALIEKYKKKRLKQTGISRRKDAADGDSDSYGVDDDDNFLTYDWRNFNVAKNIKDQGWCGSCWAFSVVASIEAQYMISKKIDVELSEQQLIDCSKKNHGCNGGFLDAAFKYVLSSDGLCTEEEYPYLEVAKNACFIDTCKKRYPVTSIHRINIDQLKKAIRYIGPISVDIHVNYSFVYYQKGIFEGKCEGNEEPNHTVLAIGYGVTNVPLSDGHSKDVYYYIVKNSWGSHWGEQGYMRIITSPDGTRQECKFATEGYVATVEYIPDTAHIRGQK